MTSAEVKSNLYKALKGIKAGSLSDVKRAVAETPEILDRVYDFAFSSRSYTPLAYAYHQKRMDICTFLIAMGSDVNVQTGYIASAGRGEYYKDISAKSYSSKEKPLFLDALISGEYEYAKMFAQSDTFSLFPIGISGYAEEGGILKEVLVHDDILNDIAPNLAAAVRRAVSSIREDAQALEERANTIERLADAFDNVAEKQAKKKNIQETASKVGVVKKFSK